MHVKQFSIVFSLLLATAGSIQAQRYDLRGPAPAQGTIVQNRVAWKMPKGTLTMESGGETKRLDVAQESSATRETEVVQTAGGRLAMLRYRVAEDWMKSVFSYDGTKVEESTTDGPLVGETVLLERHDDDWTKTMLGHEPDARQQAWMREPWVAEDEQYPVDSVAVGDSWVLEGPALARYLGMGSALSTDGKATFTLDRIAEDGDRRAIISYRLEVRTRMLNENNAPVELSVGGTGKVQRSLSTHLDVSDEFTGQMLSASSAAEEGRTVARTLAGNIEISSSERRITGSDRATVLRRASAVESTPPARTAKATSPAPAPQPVVSRPAGPACRGEALACAFRSPSQCDPGWVDTGWSGCIAAGSCSGYAAPCLGKAEYSCTLTPGCSWFAWSNSCGGFATCAGRDELGCGLTAGCAWQGTCGGTPTPCSVLDKKRCNKQAGCSWG